MKNKMIAIIDIIIFSKADMFCLIRYVTINIIIAAKNPPEKEINKSRSNVIFSSVLSLLSLKNS